MVTPFRIITLFLLLASSTLFAQSAPATKAPPIPRQTLVNIAWQVALDAADFSPGLIDGHFGRKGNMAVSEFAKANFPKEIAAGMSPLDKKVHDLLAVDVDSAVTSYTVTADDAAQVGKLPEDWNEKARLKRLPYENLPEMLAEKFHCTRNLLQLLNPNLTLADVSVGTELLVPNIRPFPVDNKTVLPKKPVTAKSIEINLAQKVIRVFDENNTQIALFHCSIARDKAKLPAEDMKVIVIAAPEPQYTFNPSMWPEVKNVSTKLQIPPGPRNPVGLAWVGLSKPGYGMHGTPKPELIGKTGSHGCFRLTNWDALKLAGLARIDMIVKVTNPETGQ